MIGAVTPAGVFFNNVTTACREGLEIGLLPCKDFPQVSIPQKLVEHIRSAAGRSCRTCRVIRGSHSTFWHHWTVLELANQNRLTGKYAEEFDWLAVSSSAIFASVLILRLSPFRNIKTKAFPPTFGVFAQSQSQRDSQALNYENAPH
jgi:hypothetical protein